MRKSRSCVSLKLASTQISLSDRMAIELCPASTLLPGLTFRRVTTSSISATDIAVTKLEFSLNEIAFRGFELRFRLLDGRRIIRKCGQRTVDIALIEALELLEHLLRQLFIRMSNAKLRGRLDESCLRLSDGRESLIEIGRHLAEISAFRLRQQPQGDTDLMDIRLCLDNVRLRDRKCGLPLTTRLMSSLVMACGTGQPLSYGVADGASGVHPPSSSVTIGLSPAPGGVVGPFRPASASCTPSLATP